MTVFQIVGVLVFVGCWWAWASQRGHMDSSGNFQLSRFDRWIPYPDAVRWVLYVMGVVILLAGIGMNSGPGCFTDWDGVSNPTVCN